MTTDPYWRHLIRGTRDQEWTGHEHYWRWPVAFHLRWLGRWTWHVSFHGVRDGVVRGLGPYHPAVRSFLWLGPVGIEFGWRRQVIEDWRWRRALRRSERRS